MRYTIPRFTFLGPEDQHARRSASGCSRSCTATSRPGAPALLKLLQTLAAQPSLAAGYDLVVYPVCNPTGYEDDTRHNRRGADLNREFWRGSVHPEIGILEEELRTQSFDGIVALHADDTSDGIYGYAHDRLLNKKLLEPALRASERVLPAQPRRGDRRLRRVRGRHRRLFPGRAWRRRPSRNRGLLRSFLRRRPRSPLDKQAEAAHSALLAILATYRGFAAYAQDL